MTFCNWSIMRVSWLFIDRIIYTEKEKTYDMVCCEYWNDYLLINCCHDTSPCLWTFLAFLEV